MENSKYSIFRNNDVIIKIKFLVIMLILFKNFIPVPKKNNDVKNNVTSIASLDLVSVSLN